MLIIFRPQLKLRFYMLQSQSQSLLALIYMNCARLATLFLFIIVWKSTTAYSKYIIRLSSTFNTSLFCAARITSCTFYSSVSSNQTATLLGCNIIGQNAIVIIHCLPPPLLHWSWLQWNGKTTTLTTWTDRLLTIPRLCYCSFSSSARACDIIIRWNIPILRLWYVFQFYD